MTHFKSYMESITIITTTICHRFWGAHNQVHSRFSLRAKKLLGIGGLFQFRQSFPKGEGALCTIMQGFRQSSSICVSYHF